VAVLDVPSETEVRIDDRDLEWTTCRSGGPGGQNVNKTETAVQVTHKPSGLQVRCESERSQLQNRTAALATLRARLQSQATTAATRDRNDKRKSMVGSGQRGDKTRTYRWQDNIVTDHTTGKKSTWEKVRRGDLDDLG
jgi:peptide chain release factor 1